LLQGGPQPGQRGAEIFRPFAVETVLMRAEARDAGLDLAFHLVLDAQRHRADDVRRLARLDGSDRQEFRLQGLGWQGLSRQGFDRQR
jgi:hypothetical protein